MRLFLSAFVVLCSISSQAQFSEFESIDFSKPDSIAALYPKYSLRNQKKLTLLLTRDLNSDVEKFRAIYKWITNNISYDVDLYKESIKKKRELSNSKKKYNKWNKSFYNKNLRRLITNRSAVCQGYASLLETMCGFADIQCIIVSGYGRSESDRIGYGQVNHAWNAVFLNNKWHLCDATWSSGYVDDNFKEFTRKFNKNYFLPDPMYFVAEHYPTIPKWTLLTNNPTLKDFLDAPHRTSGFIENKINHYTPTAGLFKVKKDSLFRFSFTSNLPENGITETAIMVYQKKRKRKGKGKKKYEYIDRKECPLSINKEGYYYFDYSLLEKGAYRIRIFLNRSHAFTYEVNVK
jgi:Transglutaminase-like superfamily